VASSDFDSFFYRSTGESRLFSADLIVGGIAPNRDFIHLDEIDADTTTAGNQAFKWALSLTGHAGEAVIYYMAARDVSQFQGDVDGDGLPDFVLEMAGNHVLDLGMFIL
jgi:hypothetical protein